MWYVYIIYSKSLNRHYIGYTEDLEWRLERHNSAWGRYTCKGIPWELVYYEKFAAKTEAIKREREIKKKKSKKYIEKLIHAGGRPEPKSN
ncbi:MAG: GIY-YIG nuclease family protein [Bacteroidetes bacterium]|nr:GIY-YIG nuclease family protein [Bacteroidota bacterium]